ncbi:MAG: transcriptional repressor [Alphaproteobacteria bacterium]|nr:transcriptional repressor [Alphaproteobacteria bacterium]
MIVLPADHHALGRLRTVGLRPTRQRLALARLLFRGGHRHLTADELHTEATGAEIRVSLATVYNTLHQFTKAGLLREVAVDATRSYFDTNTADHHHYYFEDSGKLLDIHGERVALARLPTPPAGCEIARIDVVVRLRARAASKPRSRAADD